ncbi:response regulator [Arcobacteraceae bacterium]|nr:response regulator [Arcobacteraceae bacterium]
MIVEDDESTVTYLSHLLEDIFDDIIIANDGLEALEYYKKEHIDLIITDINMPNMDGIQLIENIRKRDSEISIIILSSHNESHFLMKGIELGVNGYILKPVNVDGLLRTLMNTIETINLRIKVDVQKAELESINNDLEQEMIKRISQIYALNQEIKETQKEVVLTMAQIGECRSKETGNHVKRVSLYSELFAKYSGLNDEEIELIKEASPMHDIGKIAIPDSILNKPSRLTNEEMEVMKTHAKLGYDMLKHSSRDLLRVASLVAYEHHERYDGLGYPRSLQGEEISIYGRITAIADVFDALGSARIYKDAWSDERIFTLFEKERAKHFDPELVDIFFKHKEEFFAIRDSYNDV